MPIITVLWQCSVVQCMFILSGLEYQPRIKINGECINNIRYADDAVIMANTFEELQKLVTRVEMHFKKYCPNLTSSKTKYIVVSKAGHKPGILNVNGQIIKQVRTYNYLGTTVYKNLKYLWFIINEKGTADWDVKYRMNDGWM